MRFRLFALALVLFFVACGESKQTLVIYTTHGKDLVEEYVAKFEEQHPDVRVYAIDMGSQDALDRIRSEKVNPQASLWWGAPAPLFMQAKSEGLLAPFRPSWAASVDSIYHDDEDFWYGSFLTPEVISYNSERLTKETAPQDWDDLLKPEWENRIVIRQPLASGTMRAIWISRVLESIRKTGKPDAGFDWLRALDKNTGSYAADPTILYIKLARSETDVTLWNMPDIMLQKNQNGYPFDFVLPKSGTVIVTDCMALVKNAPKPDLAKSFYEFVTTKEALAKQAHDYYRIPARSDIEKDKLPEWMREPIKAIPMNWKLFAEKSNEWMRYWDENIRNQGK